VTTYLDNILKTCVQKARLLVFGIILLPVLIFLLSPADADSFSSSTQAATPNLISARNCLKLRVEAQDKKLSSQDLADLLATYSSSAKIEQILLLNPNLSCGGPDANREDRESLCLEKQVGTICFPLN
jgi:hypothetical protein